MRRNILLLVLAISSLQGCPHNGPTIEGGRATRPGWIPSPNRSHPDFLFVTGICRDQSSMAAARACAIDNARTQVQQQLGGHVQIKGSYVKDEYSEQRHASGGPVRDHWVLVSYPRRELRKEQTRIANRVLLGLSCRSTPPGSCDPRYPEAVESAMTSAGMTPAPQRLATPLMSDIQHALTTAARQRAARLMLVTLEAKFLSSMDGEFYANARCGFRLIDAVSGKVQTTFESGDVKGGHIAKDKAVRRALDNCMKTLTARATTLK